MSKTEKTTLNTEQVHDYLHYIVLPLKMVGCWDWYPKPQNEYQIIINYVYVGIVLFILSSMPMALFVQLYIEGADIMESLEQIADGLPLLVSVAIVVYFAIYKQELYELVDYINANFKYRSANGLTNSTMWSSYKAAKNFGYVYTACALFSITMYVTIPVIIHFWTGQPLLLWAYMDLTRRPFFVVAFLRLAIGQIFVALSVGELGVFFGANAILICGQLDLLCCSLRNARYTALLRHGVRHNALVASHADIRNDEKHNYMYCEAELRETSYHYDEKMNTHYIGKTSQFDIYSSQFDEATTSALRDCAAVSQTIKAYKEKFESFVSPLLVLRVVQLTLYLCMLLYAATGKFDTITVEYIAAVALDLFVYCYFGNKIISQADRVSTAGYQSSWHAMGTRPRRVLLNLLLANKHPTVIRAGRFLPMDLHTYLVAIKTSFSYYTLLVNVNEKK